MTLFEQMGNIGSEVDRVIRFRRRGDMKRSEAALFRALDLLDLTLSDPRWQHQSRLKEMLRIRECLGDYFLGENSYGMTDASWEKYFLPFAIAARKDR